MRRVSDAKPPPSTSSGVGRGSTNPPRTSAGAEIFGRFVHNLARLEGKPGSARSDKEGRR
jgi:hypothetical protein